MLTWISQLSPDDFSETALHYYQENDLFFDIETTGLSSKYHNIYCIGCCYRQGASITAVQFFACSPADEAEILTAFLTLAQDYERLISFNGLRFDLPFIEVRCRHHRLACSLSKMEHLDLFQTCSRLKHLLSLPSCKQKSIEHFLGIDREDAYDGGRLIPIYLDYVRSPSSEAEQLLKLHNFEDVIGMIRLLPMLAYTKALTEPISISAPQIHDYTDIDGNRRQELLLEGRLPAGLPIALRLRNEHCYLLLEQDNIRCSLPLVSGPLKYFLKDYRNYDFLMEEQTILHKSLSAYVPKDRRRPAAPHECFLLQQGVFFFLPKDLPLTEETKQFQENYEIRERWLLYTEDVADAQFWCRYLGHLLNHFAHKKQDGPA